MHIFKLSLQKGILQLKCLVNLEVSKTEYCGRFAGVGNCEEVTGHITQFDFDISLIANENSYHVVVPELQ